MSAVGTKPATLYLHRDDVAWKGVDFGPLLAEGVTLTGGAAITIDPAMGLDVSNEAINSVEFSDADPNVAPIAEDEGVIGKFDPLMEGEYTVTFAADTSDGQHLAVDVQMVVQ